MGVFVFDHTLQEKLINDIDTFISFLRINYGRYLQNNVESVYDPNIKSIKPWTYRSQIIQLIRNIITELVENIVQHAGGIGYFSAHIYNGILHLFVGDSGIGLRDGILNNYNLINTIKTDKEALQYAFQLTTFQDKRKENHHFNEGAGYGLRDTLHNIFLCKGKFICRTGSDIATFVNPVNKATKPSKVIGSSINITGTQYYIMIPLIASIDSTIPRGTSDFMDYKD